jgi:hypothetical protein
VTAKLNICAERSLMPRPPMGFDSPGRADRLMRSIHLAFVAIALGVGCGEKQLAPSVAIITADPEVQFGAVRVGDTKTRTITISNNGRASATLKLEVSEPFSATGSVEIAAGAVVHLEVRFTPSSTSSFRKTLSLLSGTRSASVELVGRGANVVCESEACVTRTYDPSANHCSSLNVPNGTACETSCVVDGRCKDGVCAGVDRHCDDGLACTSNSCTEGIGCISTPEDDACPEPSSPCQVRVCNPGTGCGVVPILDGTPCGPEGCSTARTCAAGACSTTEKETVDCELPERLMGASGFVCGVTPSHQVNPPYSPSRVQPQAEQADRWTS